MEKYYGVIYKITNNLNKKAYIGQTTYSAGKRVALHFNAAEKLDICTRANTALHRAIKKYGKSNFSYDIVCYANDADELNELEKFYIVQEGTRVPNGYNVAEGGFAGKWSEEAKIRISKIRQKQIQENPELRKKLAEPLLRYRNKFSSDEYKIIMSEISKSYWSLEENRVNKSQAMKTRWKNLTEEQRQRQLKGFTENNAREWTKEERRKRAELVKGSKKYKNSNHTKKMMAKCAHKIKATSVKSGDFIVFESKTKVCKHLQISYQKFYEALNNGTEYKGYKFEKIQ